MRMIGSVRWAMFALLLTSLGVSAQDNYQKFVALGSGSQIGTYYHVATDLCAAINNDRLKHGIRCVNRSTGGSIYNIKALQSGQLDMAITRWDLLDEAIAAQPAEVGLDGDFRLRHLKTLYSMPLVAFAKADRGIESLEDIVGKRVNIGEKGSGKRSAASAVFDALGWSSGDFSELAELGTAAMVEAFCNDEIDVFFEALANPNSLYAKVIDDCEGRFITMSANTIERVLSSNASFRSTPIPAGLYNHQPIQLDAIGFEAVLATTNALNDASVEKLMQILSIVPSP